MKTFLTLLASLAVFPVAVHAAPLVAVNWNGLDAEFFSDDDGPFTLGFRFRADSDLTVSSLGAFDYLGDGLATAHMVGIWSLNGGAPLAVATVASGSSAPLLGAFRYGAIVDLTLSANTEYIIGASDFYGQDFDIYPYAPHAFSTASGVTLLASRESASGAAGLVFPESSEILGGGAPLAANFQFVAVPEPSGYLLLCAGLASAFVFRRCGGGLRRDSNGRRGSGRHIILIPARRVALTRLPSTCQRRH